MKKLLSLLFCLIALNFILNAEPAPSAILEAKVTILPAYLNDERSEIIQPGSPIVVTAQIKNIGTKNNENGYFFVRFTYPNPLAGQKNSELYVTEKITLPSIEPGKTEVITFKTTQSSPTLYDFIRQDFGMRQYQAVAVIDSKEYMIGSASLTFSAYYYAGPTHEIPTEVPAR